MIILTWGPESGTGSRFNNHQTPENMFSVRVESSHCTCTVPNADKKAGDGVVDRVDGFESGGVAHG